MKRLAPAAVVLSIALGGCGQSGSQAPPEAGVTGTRPQLLDPRFCGTCHADHYADWAASMHAYAADDPIFRAMNARGQRETDGGLGVFCVNCHAPMAVRDGRTTDGLNLDSLPGEYHGVTCFFCHSVSKVDGTNNAAVTIADDLVMRGEYSDPVPNGVHQSEYSALNDANKAGSAAACGACHDIVTPKGVHIERTFAEWQATAFNSPAGSTCAASGCHMVQEVGVPIAQNVLGVPNRTLHRHDFPAVDVPIVAAGDGGAPAPLAAAVENKLASSIIGALCVTSASTVSGPAGGIRVILDALALGHGFPSGAAQDRRLWIEVNAYQGTSAVPFFSSGHVAVGASPVDATGDPDRWLLRDCMFGDDGAEVHMFWQASGTTDDNALPALQAFLPDPRAFESHIEQFFPRDGTPLIPRPDRVTLNVWLQPVGSDVLDDLVDSGDLDASVLASMPLFPVPLGPGPDQVQLLWTSDVAADSGIGPFADSRDRSTVTCVGTLKSVGTPAVAPMHRRCSP